jgi:hypothetical protein
VSNIAYRENMRWKAFGAGLNSPAGALAVIDDQVFAGGFFGMAGEADAAFIAAWDGDAWSSLGEGVGNTIIGFPLTMAASSNALVVGGSFHTAGTNRVSNVAAWNGNSWAPLGRGLRDGHVISSAWVGDRYYAAGRFTLPNGRRAVVAQWDGSDWRAIAMHVDNSYDNSANVFAVTEHRGMLYTAGNFSRIDGVATTNVAMWNGTRWVQVGTNPPVPTAGLVSANAMVKVRPPLLARLESCGFRGLAAVPTWLPWGKVVSTLALLPIRFLTMAVTVPDVREMSAPGLPVFPATML